MQLPPEQIDPCLIECANAARQIAQDLCAPDIHLETSCAWYHGIWPSLRVLGLVTTPSDHRAFYRETLQSAGSARRPRLLISGSADYAMLEQVHAAFRSAEITPEIVFTDRCPTAVALAHRYATATDIAIKAHAVDILALNEDPFDIVCTHSFMGYFDNTVRRDLIAKWSSLLRPGGKLITINRLRPQVHDIVRFTPNQKARFVENVRFAAAQFEHLLDASVEEIVQGAARYAENFRIHPLRSTKDLRQSLEANGFHIELMEERFLDGHAESSTSGPTTPEGACYVHLIAVRV